MANSRLEPTTPSQFVHRRAGHVMVAYEGRLYVWGGYMELPHLESYTLNTPSKSMYHRSDEIWVYDPLLDTWTSKSGNGFVPQQLSGSCAAVHGDHMYLFGGWTSIQSELMENNLNYLWRLHLPTLTWELLKPEGTQPYPCDKAACWVHKNRFYVFGGFGPSTSLLLMKNPDFNFVPDNIYHSGWIDQLVYYDIESNRWVWPSTWGPKPSPRAAHAADVTGDKVYIFGGRFQDVRMNDLHCLDLTNWTWSGNLTDGSLQEAPEGRSWHTFNFVSKNKAVIYGGFNTTQQVLKDVWLLDVSVGRWEQVHVDRTGKVLWHTSAATAPGEVIYYGGIRNNLLDMSKPKDHAEDMVILRFSPPTLQRLVIETCCRYSKVLHQHWHRIPRTLQQILEVRLNNSINSS
ncbi:hypothetical protein Pcinc_028003 [Petrolisthes cinctipes]|uniref:Kelch domain-containing protein 2 n=1 Tax=Petrolisthes cinctipes TaxID=88211 RepID=A0AAE1F2S4_PETCI|nr:hypothetical protein Pcinc_028003 [Petrolisthes cinctipes]